MFENLRIHIRCNPCTYAELIIGESPNINMPPSAANPILPRITHSNAERREPTTEMKHGAGSACEYRQGVCYA